jgi:hypothetical protein
MTTGTSHIPLELLHLQGPLSVAYLSNHTYNYETYKPANVKTYFTQVVCTGAIKAKFKDCLNDHHRSNRQGSESTLDVMLEICLGDKQTFRGMSDTRI